MKWLLTGLCIIAVAPAPVAASANVECEGESADRIVIAYIPEHLQLRVPGQTDERHTSPTLPQGVGVQPVADASGGLEWDMWAPEPKAAAQQPKFEVEYVPPTADARTKTDALKGPRAFLISMAALTAAGGVVMGAGVAAQVRRPVSAFEKHPGMSAAQAGLTLAAAGAVGMIIGGAILHVRKRQLRNSQRDDYATLSVGPLHVTGIEGAP